MVLVAAGHFGISGFCGCLSSMSLSMRVLVVLVMVLQATSTVVADKVYSISSSYIGDQCSGTPYSIWVAEDTNCSTKTCAKSTNTSTADMLSVECSTDYLSVMRAKFGNAPYLLQIIHIDENCTELGIGFGYPASGTCVGGYSSNESYYVIADLNANGSASLAVYTERSCFSDELWTINFADKNTLANHSCDINMFRWYSSNDKEIFSSAPTEVSGGEEEVDAMAIFGAVVGCLLGVVVIAVFVLRRRRSNSDSDSQKDLKESLHSTAMESLEAAIQGQAGLWNDDVITAKRIPLDKVLTQDIISRGSFGEVYFGTYKDQKVAVKILLPALRDNLNHVTDFLAEAKMTATMDHPHIVTFVGVAWDALSDLCVVLEFMEGGELRSLLDDYERTDQPIGFDRHKATIALQVCHALTYLHSLSPPVIHRDLKSRNILLNKKMEAKLSDFGISRERMDRTMTAGVGTSLWMAPEVMLGERYDVKADIFSFGVVLSELDVHEYPYARIKRQNAMSDSILLQKVALGLMTVDFSEKGCRPLTELGRACVAIDPTERPSAAEALYQLQVILASRKLR